MVLHIKEDIRGKRILTEDEFRSEQSTEAVVHAFVAVGSEYGWIAGSVAFTLLFAGIAFGWYWFVRISEIFIIARIFLGLLIGGVFGGLLFWASIKLLGKKK